MADNKGRKTSTAIVVIVIILLICVISLSVMCFVLYSKINTFEEIKRTVEKSKNGLEILETSVSELKKQLTSNEFRLIELERGFVDFTSSSIQDIGDGFCVAGIDASIHLTGIKIRGRILNTTSVDHRGATFKVRIGRSSNTLTIMRISSGNSTGFEVYIPDVAPSDAKFGNIKYKSSTVLYRK